MGAIGYCTVCHMVCTLGVKGYVHWISKGIYTGYQKVCKLDIKKCVHWVCTLVTKRYVYWLLEGIKVSKGMYCE